jgi:flagellar biosynthetic protein FliR
VDDLLSNLPLIALRSPDIVHVVQGASGAFVAFILVLTRLTGMVVLGPVFGHPHVPVRFRALLVLGLSLVITPVLVGTNRQQTFEALDRNGDGELTVAEVPQSLAAPVAGLLERFNKSADSGLIADEFFLTLPIPETWFECARLLLVEFALGMALGLGVSTIVSGLQVAGSLIDQQIGTTLGGVFNPQFQSDVSQSGEFLNQLGLAVFLIAGGHYLMISALLDTFQALPVGYAWVSTDLIELLNSLFQQSLALAVQVAAPVLATMALVGLAMGFLGHSIPQLNVMIVGFPVRALVGWLILGLAIPTIAELLGRVLPGSIEQLRQVMVGGSN